MRLNKFLARTGIGSRRQCDEYIKNNLIKINGKVETDFSYQVSSSDSIKYNNKILNYVEEDYLYILNKPINYICTSSDQYGRKKVVDLIPLKIRLFTVGRLDYKTTGIILLTNNGDLANKLMHPKYNILRKYYVESNEKISSKEILNIKKGIKRNKNIFKAKIIFEKKNQKSSTYIWQVVLTEGKNREIREIFEYLNVEIIKLHRYEFFGLKLGNLKSGKYKKIKINTIKKMLNI